MSKTLKYSAFVIACALVIVAFITAKSYTQLGAAVLLYPLAVFFAYKLFLDRKVPVIRVLQPSKLTEDEVEKVMPKREQVDVADIDKRAFLKFIGAAGISFFLFSLLGRRVENLLFGNPINPGITGLGYPPQGQVDATANQPTDGYLISEIDDNYISYYGFTNKVGAWFIMRENPDDGSFRYTKGNKDFPDNWANRKNLKYDYFSNVFP